MQEFAGKVSGFSALNNALRASNGSPGNCPYSWDGETVALKNAAFDEQAYRFSKREALSKRSGILTSYELMQIVDSVLAENEDLLLKLSYAGPSDWKELDRKLEFLIESACVLKEHECHLKSSQRKIQEAQAYGGSWMSFQEVQALLDLGNKRSQQSAPDPLKFVNNKRNV